jgi:hypothetical protein
MKIWQAASTTIGNDAIQFFYLVCSNFCFQQIGIVPSIVACKKNIEKIKRFGLQFDEITESGFEGCRNGAEVKLSTILQLPPDSAMCDLDVMFLTPIECRSPCALNSEKIQFYQDYRNCDGILEKCIPSFGFTANAGFLYCSKKSDFDCYAVNALRISQEFRNSGNIDNGICFEQMYWMKYWENKKIQCNFLAKQSANNYEGCLEMLENFKIFHPIGGLKRAPSMIRIAVNLVRKTQFKNQFESIIEKTFPEFLST